MHDEDTRSEDAPSTSSSIRMLAAAVHDEFESTRRVLSFSEWFELLEANPMVHARSAAQYVRDAMLHFERRPVRTPSGPTQRFNLFDRGFDDGYRLVGQESAQNAIFEVISGYCRLGRVDSLILLHGPNGSAKSTILESLQRGVEAYSHTDEGAAYRFSWVFPNRRFDGGGIGFGGAAPGEGLGDESFAALEAEALDARLGDENKDHPIYLIPPRQRKALLERIDRELDGFVLSETIKNGDLSARNRRIFDALLNNYKGDLEKVYQHVQVERFFMSRNYRTGLVDVEPKQTVDARSFAVTGDRAFAGLPASVGGQALFGTQGDLVDANRGIINFSDLLKRPYEHFKYLLSATETARVALDQVVLNLDVVFTGSANDINLLSFRAGRSAEYQSFRARLDLVPVPYLLDYRVERKIYQEQVGDLLRGVHIAPHVPRILALWGVMTRLRQPDPEKYVDKVSDALKRLTPIEKADLYAYGRVPKGLSSEEARELIAAVPSMFKERFQHSVVRAEGSEHLLGDYEGSFGASVRDLKGVLLSCAAEPETTCVSVPKLFAEIRRYLDDRVNHRWMELEKVGAGFHSLDGEPQSISEQVWQRWLDLSDREVREALGLVDEERYMQLFKKYVVHAKHYVKKERIFDEVTGRLTDPDEKFMAGLEESMDPNAGEGFRADILARIGAWALSHPDEEPAYAEIFADYFARMREDYYRRQKDTVHKGISYMLELLTEERLGDAELELSVAEKGQAQRGLEVLLGEHDEPKDARERHTRESLRETLVQLSKHRY
jgi:predicted Ser/Thr protein kinase